MDDSLARNIIINELHKNIFVTAGAGSGKTTILVNRMVALVEDGIDVRKICAITFTKNAATEFKNRFISLLYKRIHEDSTPKYPGDLKSPTEETRKRDKEALAHIDECFMGTIDSFCNQIVSEHPLEASVSPDCKIIEDDKLISLYKKEYEKIARGEIKDFALSSAFKDYNAIHTDSPSSFASSIEDMLDVSVLPLDFTDGDAKAMLDEIKDEFEGMFRDDLNILFGKDSYGRTLENDVYIDTNPKSKDKDKYKKLYAKLKDSLRTYEKEWTLKTISNVIYFYNEAKNLRFNENPGLNLVAFKLMPKNKCYCHDKDAESKMDDLLLKIKELIYFINVKFLSLAKDYIRKDLKENGTMSFTDYLLAVRDMCLNDMDSGMHLINHIRERHSVFLLDESQDTSPIQTEIFFYLSSKTKARSKRECKLIPGSLFIVGDPKQSIYRFRGADVLSYMDTKTYFNDEDNITVELTQNFRSADTLCEYYNEVFHTMENYKDIPITGKLLGGSGVFLCDSFIPVIQTLVHNEKYKVWDKEKEILRTLEYKDFMIITKKKDHKDEVSLLKENHIPYYEEGSLSLSDNPLCEEVYAIYCYLAEDDTSYYYNMLASSYFDMSPLLMKSEHEDSIYNEKMEALNALKKRRDILGPLGLYDEVLSTLNLYLHTDYEKLEYAYFMGEKLKDASIKGTVSDFKSAVFFLNDLIHTPIERAPKLDIAYDAVYLANLHKVKGLEAYVVILSDAGYKTGTVSYHMDYLNNKSYLIRTDKRVINHAVMYNAETKRYTDIEEREKEALDSEWERLKYVAATRARNFLFIMENKDKKESFWQGLTENIPYFLDKKDEDEKRNEVSSGTLLKNEKPHFEAHASYSLVSPSKLEIKKLFTMEESEYTFSNIKATTKGTIIHRLMERLVSMDVKPNKKILISSIMGEYGIKEMEYEALLDEIYDKMMDKGYSQNNGLPSDILTFLKKCTCYCEVPFSYKKNDNVIYGIMDLVYLKDGKYTIIDYKTNYESESHKGSVNYEKEYEEQLTAYKNALREILGVEAEAYIYHIG